MTTLFANFLAGVVDDAPLTSGATTINSSGFANLPVVSSPDIMWLVLDPDEDAGEPELVKVTTHTSSATSVTVDRGQQSTTAREHAATTVWRAVVTKSDMDTLVAFLEDSAVDTANLADSAVTTAKLADGSVTAAKTGDRSEWTASQLLTTTPSTVAVDTEVQDDLSMIAAASADMTIPSDGAYRFTVEVDVTGATPTVALKTGSGTYSLTDNSQTGQIASNRWAHSFTAYLQAADVVNLYGSVGSGTATTTFRVVIQKVA